jgi:aerobic carbon-monoxide dehydrogenase medium subunit
MIPGEFNYLSPSTVQEAVAMLADSGPDAKILAGGQSLIPAMRFRLAVPSALVDINRLKDLQYIREDNGHLAIGALTRESSVEDSDVVNGRYAMLADAAKVIADPVVRNMATVGGNLAHADPANEHPAVMLAYNASIVVTGSSGTRTIPIDNFFLGLFACDLREGEILTEIRIPKPGPQTAGAYVKLERKVGDYAISAVAVQLTVQGGVCTAARIGLTNVNPVSMRAKNAEQALIGNRISDETIEAAGKAAASECDPSPDLRGGVDYKRDITRVLTKRAIHAALERIK